MEGSKEHTAQDRVKIVKMLVFSYWVSTLLTYLSTRLMGRRVDRSLKDLYDHLSSTSSACTLSPSWISSRCILYIVVREGRTAVGAKTSGSKVF